MTSITFRKNQIFTVHTAFNVGEKQVLVNTRAIVAKGGLKPHIEFLINNNSDLVAVEGSDLFFSCCLGAANPIYDEALKGYSVKKIKYAQGEQTKEIYLELFKGGQLVATGHNNGRGEGNHLRFIDPNEREGIEKFLDETTIKIDSLPRGLISEEFVVFLAMYFNSGFCTFESFLKMTD